MGHTRNKLSEAAFFLGKLEQAHFEYPEFNYYLSAFVSSSRSVTWVMRSEYLRVDGWQGWYDARMPTSEEAILLQKFNDVRVRTEKVEFLETSFRVTFHIPKEYFTDDLEEFFSQNAGKQAKLIVTPVENEAHLSELIEPDEEHVTFHATFEEGYRAINDFPDEGILAACKSYYALLGKLVDECESLFGS